MPRRVKISKLTHLEYSGGGCRAKSWGSHDIIINERSCRAGENLRARQLLLIDILSGELRVVQVRVESVLGEERVMRPLLDYVAVIHYEDPVGVLDS